ncbi:MAG TPA: hypothetical protein VGL99_08870 [Chloroflexota bacterium]|jgi:hypothetical protein
MDTSSNCSSSSSSTDAFDEPYRFGRRPSVAAPFPFTDRQFARLLALRSRLEVLAADDHQAAA